MNAITLTMLQATLPFQDISEHHAFEPRKKIQKLMPELDIQDLNTILVTGEYLLGVKYRQGFELEKNSEEAFTLIKKSAERDYAPAQYDLYVMYKNGIGIEADLEQAIKWCKKAAMLQYPAAENDLAAMYELGNQYIKVDKEMAIEFYEKALHHDYPLALENLERLLDSE